jgi:hypothetical protein
MYRQALIFETAMPEKNGKVLGVAATRRGPYTLSPHSSVRDGPVFSTSGILQLW